MELAWKQLKAYAEHRDQAAFAALVQHHLALVYSAALRQLGDSAAAEEVTQSVFVLLAEKSATLQPSGSLAAWLYRTACFKAKKSRQRESARRERERRAYAMNDMQPAEQESPSLDWARVAPLLDAAMASLSEPNRTAILLRFFEKRSLIEVGASLGISEEAARKRVDRSVDKLRLWFQRRGLTCSSIALTSVMNLHSVQALPVTLTVSSIQTAVAQSFAATAPSAASFLTAMASTKAVFVAALVLAALVPISLPYLRPARESGHKSTPPTVPTPELPLPSAQASGLIAEWESLMARYGPADGSLAQVYEVIKNVPDDFRRRAFRGALITEWMTRAPHEALTYFQAHDSGQVTLCLREWLRIDPTGAIAAMQSNPAGLKDSIALLLGEIAESRPDAAPGLAQHVDKKTAWTHYVRDAFAQLGSANPAGALAEAESLEGPQRTEALAGVAMGWAKIDGEAALDWAQGLDEKLEGKDWILRSLLVGWAQADPGAALDHLAVAPPGGSSLEFANDTGGQVLRAAAKADYEATLAWIARNPGKLGHEALGGLSEELGARLRADPAATLDIIRDHPTSSDLLPALGSQLLNEGFAHKDAIWDWLERQEDSPFVRETRLRLLRSAAWKEPETAIRWLEESSASLDSEEVSQVIVSTFNGGSNLAAVEAVMDRAPEDLREMLLIQSFGYLVSRDAVPLESWIERLDQLPVEERPEASAAVARQLASVDPSQAIAWADSLTDPNQSMKALSGAVASWARMDSYECSEWIAELPGGTRRDHAARALADSIVQAEPDSAWHWAKTIQNPELRTPALQQAFQLMEARDPQTANAWLQDPALPAADRTTLTRQ